MKTETKIINVNGIELVVTMSIDVYKDQPDVYGFQSIKWNGTEIVDILHLLDIELIETKFKEL